MNLLSQRWSMWPTCTAMRWLYKYFWQSSNHICRCWAESCFSTCPSTSVSPTLRGTRTWSSWCTPPGSTYCPAWTLMDGRYLQITYDLIINLLGVMFHHMPEPHSKDIVKLLFLVLAWSLPGPSLVLTWSYHGLVPFLVKTGPARSRHYNQTDHRTTPPQTFLKL